MAGPRMCLLKHIEKFKEMAKKKKPICPHCISEELDITISEEVDGRGHTWKVTNYNCKNCKFYGRQYKRNPE